MPIPRKTVLVVEDDDDLRHMFRDALKFSGFDVREATDGVEALETIDIDPPDLIVLDIGLPTLDGVSLRDELAATSATKDIPIVVVTGATVEADRLKGTRVLLKPVPPDDLVAAVRASLADVSARRFGSGRSDGTGP